MFISTYLDLLSSNPIATVLASVCLLAITIHTLAPAILGVGNVFTRYWSRGKLGKTNAYVDWFNHTYHEVTWTGSGRFYITKHNGRYVMSQVGDLTNPFWVIKSDLGAEPDPMRVTKQEFLHIGMNEALLFDSVEEVISFVMKHSYTFEMYTCEKTTNRYFGYMLILAFALFVSVAAGTALDWLIFQHTTIAIVLGAVGGGVFVTLKGGRMVFDITEKLAKLEGNNKEEDKNSP